MTWATLLKRAKAELFDAAVALVECKADDVAKNYERLVAAVKNYNEPARMAECETSPATLRET